MTLLQDPATVTEGPHATFIPTPPPTTFEAPDVWVDRDQTKGWIRRLLPVLKPHRRVLVGMLFASVVMLGMQLSIPQVVRGATDNALLARNTSLTPYVVALVLLGLGQLIFGYVQRFGMQRASVELECTLRTMLFGHLSKQSFKFYDSVQSGQLISRANSDIRAIQMMLGFGPMIAVSALSFVAALALMVQMDPLLTAVSVITLPFVFFAGFNMRKKLFPIAFMMMARTADIATIVEENVTGTRVVKSFAAEKSQLSLFDRAARRLRWASIQQVNNQARYGPLMQSIPQLSLVIILLVGGYQVIHGHMSLGTFIVFNTYVVMLQVPFVMIGMIMMMGQRAAASAARVLEVLDTEPDMVDAPDAVDLVECDGDVEFRDVDFEYLDGIPVLGHFSLHLRPGETVALVGRTGCGKSTVSRLIPRFYDVAGGSLLVDGNDVRGLTIASLRSHIGMVTDEPFLFSESIRENIAFGRPDAAVRRHRSRGSRSRRQRLHPRALRGLRHGDRRAWVHAVGWAAPAHRDRPHAARQPADPHARRRDQRGRRAARVRDPRRAAHAHARAHHAHHRPPALDDQPRRPRGRARRWSHRRRRPPRRPHARRAPLPRDPRPRRRGVRGQARAGGRGGAGAGTPRAHRAARTWRVGGQRRGAAGRSGARSPTRGDRLMWGGGGGFGGGPMMGPPPSAQGAMWGTAPGTQFAGVPPEMLERVQELLEREPDYELHDVPFTQVVDEDEKPFSLGALLWPKRWPILGVLILVAFEAFALQYGPRLVADAIDQGINPSPPGTPTDFTIVWQLSLVYVGLLVAATVVGAIRTAWSGRIGEDVLYGLRNRVFSHIQRLSLDYFTDEKAGRIMTRATSDIEAIQVLFQQGLINMWLQVCTLTVVVWQMFSMNTTLALYVVLGVVPTMTLLTIWFRSQSDYGYLAVRDWIAHLMSDLQENLSGTRVVAAHNRQPYNRVKHANIVGEYRKANLYTAHIGGVYGPGAQFIGVLAQAMIVLIGGNMVLDGTLSYGDFAAFSLYLTRLFAPIQQLAQLYNTYQQGRAGVLKLRDLFSTNPSVREKPDARELPPIEGEITLQNVTFGYNPKALVLEHVDLTIAAGETFALVGPTGAGKSTIAKLLTRFYDPLEGKVLVDGYDVRDVTLHSLRSQLGVVPQETFLFAGSIGDNIQFARPEATREDVLAACDAVGILDLINAQPQGLDTPCHERGVTLSSGERQLIALARAFLAAPRVLILDEATSSLDLATESLVERALDVLLEGRTAVLIAHRLNTAMRADRIAVVEDGKLAEVGPHADLIAMNGRYAAMFSAWQQSHEAHVFES